MLVYFQCAFSGEFFHTPMTQGGFGETMVQCYGWLGCLIKINYFYWYFCNGHLLCWVFCFRIRGTFWEILQQESNLILILKPPSLLLLLCYKKIQNLIKWDLNLFLSSKYKYEICYNCLLNFFLWQCTLYLLKSWGFLVTVIPDHNIDVVLKALLMMIIIQEMSEMILHKFMIFRWFIYNFSLAYQNNNFKRVVYWFDGVLYCLVYMSIPPTNTWAKSQFGTCVTVVIWSFSNSALLPLANSFFWRTFISIFNAFFITQAQRTPFIWFSLVVCS